MSTLEGGKLIIFKSENEIDREIKAKKKCFRIGSYLSCDVPLDEPQAKAVHCEIQTDPFGRIFVKNYCNKNPVKLNGRELKGSRPIYSGNFLQIFDRKFQWIFSKNIEKTVGLNDENHKENATETCEKNLENKIIKAAEQPPSSEPSKLKAFRKLNRNRITVHHFDCNIPGAMEDFHPDSDDEHFSEERQKNLRRTSLKSTAETTVASPPRTPKRISNAIIIKRKSTGEEQETPKSSNEILSSIDLNKTCTNDQTPSSTVNNLTLGAMVLTTYSKNLSTATVVETKTPTKSSVGTKTTAVTPKKVNATPDGIFTDSDIFAETPQHLLTRMKIQQNQSVLLIDLTTPVQKNCTPRHKNASTLLRSAVKNIAFKVAGQNLQSDSSKPSTDSSPNVSFGSSGTTMQSSRNLFRSFSGTDSAKTVRIGTGLLSSRSPKTSVRRDLAATAATSPTTVNKTPRSFKKTLDYTTTPNKRSMSLVEKMDRRSISNLSACRANLSFRTDARKLPTRETTPNLKDKEQRRRSASETKDVAASSSKFVTWNRHVSLQTPVNKTTKFCPALMTSTPMTKNLQKNQHKKTDTLNRKRSKSFSTVSCLKSAILKTDLKSTSVKFTRNVSFKEEFVQAKVSEALNTTFTKSDAAEDTSLTDEKLQFVASEDAENSINITSEKQLLLKENSKRAHSEDFTKSPKPLISLEEISGKSELILKSATNNELSNFQGVQELLNKPNDVSIENLKVVKDNLRHTKTPERTPQRKLMELFITPKTPKNSSNTIDSFDQLLKTPLSKPLKITANAAATTSFLSVDVTKTARSLDPLSICKTPVSEFARKIEVIKDSERSQMVETNDITYLSTNEIFDQLIGRPSNKKTYTRSPKKKCSEHSLLESNRSFIQPDMATKTDIQEWIDKSDNSDVIEIDDSTFSIASGASPNVKNEQSLEANICDYNEIVQDSKFSEIEIMDESDFRDGSKILEAEIFVIEDDDADPIKSVIETNKSLNVCNAQERKSLVEEFESTSCSGVENFEFEIQLPVSRQLKGESESPQCNSQTKSGRKTMSNTPESAPFDVIKAKEKREKALNFMNFQEDPEIRQLRSKSQSPVRKMKTRAGRKTMGTKAVSTLLDVIKAKEEREKALNFMNFQEDPEIRQLRSKSQSPARKMKTRAGRKTMGNKTDSIPLNVEKAKEQLEFDLHFKNFADKPNIAQLRSKSVPNLMRLRSYSQATETKPFQKLKRKTVGDIEEPDSDFSLKELKKIRSNAFDFQNFETIPVPKNVRGKSQSPCGKRICDTIDRRSLNARTVTPLNFEEIKAHYKIELAEQMRKNNLIKENELTSKMRKLSEPSGLYSIHGENSVLENKLRTNLNNSIRFSTPQNLGRIDELRAGFSGILSSYVVTAKEAVRQVSMRKRRLYSHDDERIYYKTPPESPKNLMVSQDESREVSFRRQLPPEFGIKVIVKKDDSQIQDGIAKTKPKRLRGKKAAAPPNTETSVIETTLRPLRQRKQVVCPENVLHDILLPENKTVEKSSTRGGRRRAQQKQETKKLPDAGETYQQDHENKVVRELNIDENNIVEKVASSNYETFESVLERDDKKHKMLNDTKPQTIRMNVGRRGVRSRKLQTDSSFAETSSVIAEKDSVTEPQKVKSTRAPRRPKKKSKITETDNDKIETVSNFLPVNIEEDDELSQKTVNRNGRKNSVAENKNRGSKENGNPGKINVSGSQISEKKETEAITTGRQTRAATRAATFKAIVEETEVLFENVPKRGRRVNKTVPTTENVQNDRTQTPNSSLNVTEQSGEDFVEKTIRKRGRAAQKSVKAVANLKVIEAEPKDEDIEKPKRKRKVVGTEINDDIQDIFPEQRVKIAKPARKRKNNTQQENKTVEDHQLNEKPSADAVSNKANQLSSVADAPIARRLRVRLQSQAL